MFLIFILDEEIAQLHLELSPPHIQISISQQETATCSFDVFVLLVQTHHEFCCTLRSPQVFLLFLNQQDREHLLRFRCRQLALRMKIPLFLLLEETHDLSHMTFQEVLFDDSNTKTP